MNPETETMYQELCWMECNGCLPDGHAYTGPCRGTCLAFPGLSEECPCLVAIAQISVGDESGYGTICDWGGCVDGDHDAFCRFCQGRSRIPRQHDRLEAVRQIMLSLGWRVAVHNDYTLNGCLMTFWLWTFPTGQFIKAEALTDFEALVAALHQTAKARGVVG